MLPVRIFFSKNLILYSLFITLVFQLSVTIYCHFSGYIVLSSVNHFVLQFLKGTILSFITLLLITYLDYRFVIYFNKHYSWHIQITKRFCLQFLSTICVGISVPTIMTFVVSETIVLSVDFTSAAYYNALIFSVFNIFCMAFVEARISFKEKELSESKSRLLEVQLLRTRYETLSNQISPHFFFNVLNTLSGIIGQKNSLAQEFIDHFADTSRYVLESIDKPIVRISDEIGFVESYLFLQKKRFGDSIYLKLKIDSVLFDKYIVPMSLQIVVENAIKHNLFDISAPLEIEVIVLENYLIAKNSVNPLFSGLNSTGVGQKNLIERYNFVSDLVPFFGEENGFYYSKLPIIDKPYDRLVQFY